MSTSGVEIKLFHIATSWIEESVCLGSNMADKFNVYGHSIDFPNHIYKIRTLRKRSNPRKEPGMFHHRSDFLTVRSLEQ